MLSLFFFFFAALFCKRSAAALEGRVRREEVKKRKNKHSESISPESSFPLRFARHARLELLVREHVGTCVLQLLHVVIVLAVPSHSARDDDKPKCSFFERTSTLPSDVDADADDKTLRSPGLALFFVQSVAQRAHSLAR